MLLIFGGCPGATGRNTGKASPEGRLEWGAVHNFLEGVILRKGEQEVPDRGS